MHLRQSKIEKRGLMLPWTGTGIHEKKKLEGIGIVGLRFEQDSC